MDQGEFTDANGTIWDVKSSPDTQPSYRPNAGQQIPNPQTDQRFTSMVDKELTQGNSVILDPDGMTPDRLSHLQELVRNNSAWNGRVVWGAP
jgi:hypothetical protein